MRVSVAQGAECGHVAVPRQPFGDQPACPTASRSDDSGSERSEQCLADTVAVDGQPCPSVTPGIGFN